jgi:ABC-three component (ABC-3C) system Middle Component 3
MTSWSERSRTQAVMLNPALLATITANAALQFHTTSGNAMPWAYSFIVAPLVLHRSTREALPRTTSTNWNAWVANHPVAHAGFARRAVSLRDSVQDGIRFGLRTGILQVDPQGGLLASLASGKGHTLAKDSEVQQIVARAGFVGKWLTKIEQPATVFVVLGVAP